MLVTNGSKPKTRFRKARCNGYVTIFLFALLCIFLILAYRIEVRITEQTINNKYQEYIARIENNLTKQENLLFIEKLRENRLPEYIEYYEDSYKSSNEKTKANVLDSPEVEDYDFEQERTETSAEDSSQNEEVITVHKEETSTASVAPDDVITETLETSTTDKIISSTLAVDETTTPETYSEDYDSESSEETDEGTEEGAKTADQPQKTLATEEDTTWETFSESYNSEPSEEVEEETIKDEETEQPETTLATDEKTTWDTWETEDYNSESSEETDEGTIIEAESEQRQSTLTTNEETTGEISSEKYNDESSEGTAKEESSQPQTSTWVTQTDNPTETINTEASTIKENTTQKRRNVQQNNTARATPIVKYITSRIDATESTIRNEEYEDISTPTNEEYSRNDNKGSIVDTFAKVNQIVNDFMNLPAEDHTEKLVSEEENKDPLSYQPTVQLYDTINVDTYASLSPTINEEGNGEEYNEYTTKDNKISISDLFRSDIFDKINQMVNVMNAPQDNTELPIVYQEINEEPFAPEVDTYIADSTVADGSIYGSDILEKVDEIVKKFMYPSGDISELTIPQEELPVEDLPGEYLTETSVPVTVKVDQLGMEMEPVEINMDDGTFSNGAEDFQTEASTDDMLYK